MVAGRQLRRPAGARPRTRAVGSVAIGGREGLRGPRPQGSLRPFRLSAPSLGDRRGLDLHEGQADVGQRRGQRRELQARAARRGPRPGSRRHRWPSWPRPSRGGMAPRWMAANSYSPITWLTTTVWAGISPSRALGLVQSLLRVFHDRIGVIAAHLRYRTDRQLIAKWGSCLQSAPTRPHLRQLPCVRVTTTRMAVLVAVSSMCWWLRSQTHRKDPPLHRIDQP